MHGPRARPGRATNVPRAAALRQVGYCRLVAGDIFAITDQERLVALHESPYASEDELQRLVADHPEVLSGEGLGGKQPRRWLMVAREAGLAAEPQGPARWSIDHLLIDDDGVPTLVEVKRASDTRIRREVVGQMLDYAANAVVYLPIEDLRQRFAETCASRDVDPGEVLSGFLGSATDPEDFWAQVGENLAAGRIRMLFVSDAIPAELRRIVEFLNEQTREAEVLAVELPQYVGEGLRTVVPRVIGQTAAAERAKRPRPARRSWDEAAFLAALEDEAGDEAAASARAIMEWARRLGLREWFGSGAVMGSFVPTLDLPDGESFWPITLWTYGQLELNFQWLVPRRPFDQLDMRRGLARRIEEAVSGVTISETRLDKRPSFPLAALAAAEAREAFLAAIEWAFDAARTARAP